MFNTICIRWNAHHCICKGERETIKQNIVNVSLGASNSVVRKQVSTAIEYISKSDFHDKWQSLLPDLLQRMNMEDQVTMNGVLNILAR